MGIDLIVIQVFVCIFKFYLSIRYRLGKTKVGLSIRFHLSKTKVGLNEFAFCLYMFLLFEA